MLITPDDLKLMRESARLRQSVVADRLGVTQGYISRLEKGDIDPPLSKVNQLLKILSSGSQELCREIMTSDVVTIDARDPASLAAEKMQSNDYSQLPVLRGVRLIGSISQRNILDNIHRNLHDMSVEAIMDPEGIPMVTENTPVGAIFPLLLSFDAVLVQKQGRLSGIITKADLKRNTKRMKK